jgi:hypothetical protein
MKKLITICLIMATAFTVNAQDGKPTKEQTLEYLKSVLIGIEGGQYYTMGTARSERINKLKNLSLNNCTLIYNYQSIRRATGYRSDPPDEIKNIESDLDFSTVESFETKVNKLLGDNFYHFNDNLFIYYNESKSKNNPFTYCPPDHAEKVLKALNHLRKLCGAPDPISFD